MWIRRHIHRLYNQAGARRPDLDTETLRQFFDDAMSVMPEQVDQLMGEILEQARQIGTIPEPPLEPDGKPNSKRKNLDGDRKSGRFAGVVAGGEQKERSDDRRYPDRHDDDLGANPPAKRYKADGDL